MAIDPLKQGVKRFTSFLWGKSPTKSKEINIPDVWAEVGTVQSITYTAQKGTDEIADYVHQFKKAPKLYISACGRFAMIRPIQTTAGGITS